MKNIVKIIIVTLVTFLSACQSIPNLGLSDDVQSKSAVADVKPIEVRLEAKVDQDVVEVKNVQDENTVKDSKTDPDAVSMITDTIVPPKNFKKFLKYTHNLIKSHDIEYLLFGHLGDCHLHFHLIHGKKDQKKAEEIYQKIVKKSSQLEGVYSAEHGTGRRKRNDFIECYGLEAVNQIKLCKQAFDSNMLLNHGNIIK